MEEKTETLQVRSATPAEEVAHGFKAGTGAIGLFEEPPRDPKSWGYDIPGAAPPIEAVAEAFRLNQERQRQQLMIRIRKNMKAHSSGERAQACGFARVSPFYEDAVSDDFFYKGFDGVSFDEAIREG
jgi:hypothetical protein